ncbi:MAG: hypothetical protein JWP08_1233 [Bryobacterales bacterium]|nr:hypothetical protein [Bryobacterales bacterium]
MADSLEDLTTYIETLAAAIGERNHRCYRELDDAAPYIESAFREAGCEPRSKECTARDKRFRNIEVEFRADDPGAGILVGLSLR